MNDKKKILLGVTALAGLVAAGVWIATRKAIKPPEPPLSGLTNLYGVVFDANTNAPLSGALVTLDGLTTVSGDNGYYEFLNVTPEQYTLEASRVSYYAQGIPVLLQEGNYKVDIGLPPVEIVPPPQIELNLGAISILAISGQSFIDTGYDLDGLPYVTLAQPRTVSSLEGETVKFRNNLIDFSRDDITGIIFHLFYEPDSYPPAYRGIYKPPLYCSDPIRGCPPGSWENTTRFEGVANVQSLFGGGRWEPRLYNGSLMWDKYYFDGAYFGGGEFRVKNMVRCTGSGTIEPEM